MKIGKKIFGVLLGLMISISTFANGGVIYSDASTADKSKTEGVFNFAFDETYTIEKINKTAQYYTNYFEVTPVKTESGIKVSLKLIEDNEMSRRVITRFFVSLGVKEISVDGATVILEDFIAKYVMK